MIPLVAGAWLGCAVPVAPPSPQVDVRVWLDGAPKAGGGAVVVQTLFDPAGELIPPAPVATGLTFTADGPPAVERAGGRQVIRQRYVFKGEPGFYELPPLVATWSGPDGEQQAETVPLWIDLGVTAPDVGALDDIVEPEPVWTIPWTPILVAGGALGLFIGGLGFAFGRPRAPAPAAARLSPDVRVLRAWDAIRADAALSDHEKAEAPSRLYREYVEEVLGFPATAWTTTEIVAKLAAMGQLPEGNVPRAKRLLRATDRVKFAEAHAGADLFEELDSDLRAFVASTRPAAWRDVGPPRGAA